MEIVSYEQMRAAGRGYHLRYADGGGRVEWPYWADRDCPTCGVAFGPADERLILSGERVFHPRCLPITRDPRANAGQIGWTHFIHERTHGMARPPQTLDGLDLPDLGPWPD